MFNVLKLGGDFVLRMFDINTRFSVDILYILYRYFSKVAICKPFSSRASESERFIVCLELQKDFPKTITDHLSTVFESFGNDLSLGTAIIPFKDHVRSSQSHVLSFIKENLIFENEDFIDSVQGSNMKYILIINFRLVIREREALEELISYASKAILLEYDQSEIKKRCFLEWGIKV